MNRETFKEWYELARKVDAGTATEEEYQEMLNLEYLQETEDLTYLAQVGC